MSAIHDLIVWTFVAVNAGRTLAYAPQIWAAVRCREGAGAISMLTWGYFALSNFTGAAYSLNIVDDIKLAGMFFANFFACVTLVVVVAWQRYASNPAWRARFQLR